MASVDETQNLLLETINHLAKAVTEPTSSAQLTALTTGARELAEAHAWLSAPNNSH